MSSDEYHTIDSDSKCSYGSCALARYFLESDFSNTSHHRFLPISVLHPDDRIDKSTQVKSTEEKATKRSTQINSELHNDFPSNINIRDTSVGESSINKKKEKDELRHFQYAHFRIPLYKYPFASLVAVCVPIVILACINLTIYYQGCD
jgi:hypothetical protein